MSPTHRYQSRLFQTVRSQVHQLQDTLQLRWRQLKVATTWGVQLGLYPFYTLFQAGRWGGQVLRQAAAHGKQLLLALNENPPPPDQPIQQVLAAIELESLPIMAATPAPNPAQILIRPLGRSPSLLARWGQKITALWRRWHQPQPVSPSVTNRNGLNSLKGSTALQYQSDLAQRVTLQGIASTLAQRRLVLVTAENQILDVLTMEQQRQLQQRIVWEIAQFHYQRRQRQRVVLGWKPWQALPIKVPPQASLPVRAVYGLMAWMQQQPVTQSLVQPLALPTGQSDVMRSVLPILQQAWKFLQTSPQPKARSPLVFSPQLSVPSILKALRQRLRTYRTGWVAMAGALALLPLTLGLPEPAKAAVAPALPNPLPSPILLERLIDPSRSRRRWQAEAALSITVGKPSQGKVHIAPQKSVAALSTQGFEGAMAQWASQFSQTVVAENSTTIEVDAVFMGYDHHLLEVLLLWVDRAIAWVEIQLITLWHRVQPNIQAWIQRYRSHRFSKGSKPEF